MKRRIALLLVICLLTSMVPAATAGDTVGDDIPNNGIEIVDVGGQDLTGPLEFDGIELDSDGLPDEIGDILPGGDMPELELGASLDLTDGDALLSEAETQGDAPETNDDSSDFTIEDGVLTKYNGTGGDVVIPDGVTVIKSFVFVQRYDITSVTIPSSVKIISDYAFMHCLEMTRATVAEGVAEIGEHAFWNCLKLNINIPKSVSRIGDGAFAGCAKVDLSDGNAYYKLIDGFLYTGDMKTLMFCPGALNIIVVPKGTINIGDGAFWMRDSISSVSISDGVANIGGYAFYGCKGLTEIAIPDSVTYIGEYAFCECSGMSSITIPGNVVDVGMFAFAGCEGLTKAELSSGVGKISEKCFSNCKNLTAVIIPASVVEISPDAFRDSGSVKIYGYDGSYAQAYAKEANIPFVSIGEVPQTPAPTATPTAAPTAKPTESIDDFTIENGVLTNYNGTGGDVVIPDGVTSIGRYAFMQNDSLKSVTIPDSVTELDIYAFAYCPNLISVKMMEGLKSIGNFAFAGCSGLKNIAIPKSVTVMGDEVFKECSSLESITVPGNVKSQFFWTFLQCTNLKHVTLEEGIMTIGKSEFSGCSNLTEIDIPGTLTSIDEGAFYDCEKLKSITLPDNLVSIGKNAFDSCKSLTTVVIPRQISDIKDQAFIRCSSLESVTIPEGVTRIGEAAFNGCNKLSSVTIPASVTKIGEAAFAGAITIKGYTGSYAETYAKKNKLTFVPLDAPTPEISIPKSLTLGVKETYALDAAGASFKSSNTAVAAVDKKGVITAKKAGTATITVSVKGQKAKKCKVTVVKAPAKISFAEKTVTLGVKETLALKPTITKGSHTAFTWSVGDKKVATVDKDGVVTGKKAGKTTVTVKTHNGLKATVTVTVKKSPGKVTLNCEAVTLGAKETVTLKPSIAKDSHTSFTWSVADKKIATVNQTGKITGKRAGITTVTVKTHNGKEALATVIVKKAPSKVTISEVKANVQRGGKIQLVAVLPESSASQLTWKSSKPKVATVDDDGVVTAFAIGTTRITVKTFNKKVATCILKVTKGPLDDYVIQKGVIIKYKGKEKEIAIPSSDADGNPITAIGKAAFKGNKRITRVTVPSTITKIGANAFMNCIKLESVIYPSGIRSMGNGAFQNCKKLKNITVE